jgi:hypothetical protein
MSQGIIVNVKVDLVTEICPVYGCGIMHAVPADFQERRRKDHKTFYCPNGHNASYGGLSAEEQRIKQLESDTKWYAERLNEANAREEEAKRALAATKGVLTRTKKKLTTTEKRVAHGVCPCCNRTFANVARHMKGKHPAYAGETE